MSKANYETLIQLIRAELKRTISKLLEDDLVPISNINFKNIQVERTKDLKFGDYSTNIAMSFGLDHQHTVTIAKLIADNLSKKIFVKVEVVGPGFINMFIETSYLTKVIDEILFSGDRYGEFVPKKTFYNIEFVSANPTGLLHIGHARNAAFGDALARIWNVYGIKSNREYYINDGGSQIEKLGMSTLIRYKQLFDIKVELPEDAYHGNEIIDVAKVIKAEIGDKYLQLESDEKMITGDERGATYFKDFAKTYLLDLIKKTLATFDVSIDIWFKESFIYREKLIDSTIDVLKDWIYETEGAIWLKTTASGDDKDRVLIKTDGTYTYFLPDIAYHNVKLSRGYDKIFNIWGSDHKSYADRMSIAIQLLGYRKEQFNVLIMQMVRLVKNDVEFKMSKRSGNALTLQDLLDTIGKDAARWYLTSQSLSTHIDIDVDKATAKSNDNPIYYVQYAHARINQLQSEEYLTKLGIVKYVKPNNFDLLVEPNEREILNSLYYFKHTIESIANTYEVNKLPLYLTSLAKNFHSWYANKKIHDIDNIELSAQRYYLAIAIKQVIKKGLQLLGIEATNKM